MAHRNARLTSMAVDCSSNASRQGMPVAHVAKAMGISRQCAHRWVERFTPRARPVCVTGRRGRIRMPTRTSPRSKTQVLEARVEHRRGQDWIGPELGVPARTVSRILRRHDVRVSRSATR